MKHSTLLLAVILIFSEGANAAFINRDQKGLIHSEQAQEKRLAYHGLKHHLLKQFLFKKATIFHRTPGYNSREDDPTFGIVSFAAALLSLACVGLMLASASPFIFIVLGAAAAVVAVVCGAMGLRRQMRGLAVAGMTIGIVELILGIIITAVILSFLS